MKLTYFQTQLTENLNKGLPIKIKKKLGTGYVNSVYTAQEPYNNTAIRVERKAINEKLFLNTEIIPKDTKAVPSIFNELILFLEQNNIRGLSVPEIVLLLENKNIELMPRARGLDLSLYYNSLSQVHQNPQKTENYTTLAEQFLLVQKTLSSVPNEYYANLFNLLKILERFGYKGDFAHAGNIILEDNGFTLFDINKRYRCLAVPSDLTNFTISALGLSEPNNKPTAVQYLDEQSYSLYIDLASKTIKTIQKAAKQTKCQLNLSRIKKAINKKFKPKHKNLTRLKSLVGLCISGIEKNPISSFIQ